MSLILYVEIQDITLDNFNELPKVICDIVMEYISKWKILTSIIISKNDLKNVGCNYLDYKKSLPSDLTRITYNESKKHDVFWMSWYTFLNLTYHYKIFQSVINSFIKEVETERKQKNARLIMIDKS